MDDARQKLIDRLIAAPPGPTMTRTQIDCLLEEANVVMLPPLEPGTVIPPVTLPEGYSVYDEIDALIAKSRAHAELSANPKMFPVQPQLDESRCIVCGEEATHGIICRNKELGGWDHWNVCPNHKDLNKGSEDAVDSE